MGENLKDKIIKWVIIIVIIIVILAFLGSMFPTLNNSIDLITQ